MQISFSKAATPKADAIVLPVFEDDNSALAALDAEAGGSLSKAARAAGFTGKKDKSLDIITPAGIEANRVLLFGAGKAKEFGRLDAEALGGGAVARLMAMREKSASFALMNVTAPALGEDELAARIAYGALLRSHRFDRYRTKLDVEQKPALVKLVMQTSSTRAKTVFAEFEKIARGAFLTRDLVFEPPNILYPESFAQRCRALEPLGVKVTVLNVAQMKKLGMGALLGVGQGSAKEARLVAMEWMGGKIGAAPVAFVGKGV
ncbi:MAG: M17 family peptidase N-terminal domain-containing protein, partial [Amphiplicatus sp.]